MYVTHEELYLLISAISGLIAAFVTLLVYLDNKKR